jgi:hypothetical protein
MKIKVGSIVLLKKITNEHNYFFGWNPNIKKYYKKIGVVDQLTLVYERPGARVVFKTPYVIDKFTFLLEDLVVLNDLKYLI